MNSKTSKVEGKTIEQEYTQGMKPRDEKKRDLTKNSKTWAQVLSNSASMEKETNIQWDDMQDREIKEIQVISTIMIIKGLREYVKKECTLDLASEFFKHKLFWQGRIFQAWRVGKPNDERDRPIKFIMSIIRDKQVLLSKKKLLRGSFIFLDEDFTIR
jgi:hypothetical protein